MATKIEWAEETWNPVSGCSPISPGCAHCYARRMANRLRGRAGYPPDDPFAVTIHPERLGQPLRWRKPRRIFVDSMGDLFHPDVPFDYIAAIFGVMAACSQHQFMVLTKRPARMREWFEWIERGEGCLSNGAVVGDLLDHHLGTVGRLPLGALPDLSTPWPLSNVMLGVTAEDQQRADERVSILEEIPAAQRFISVEPMLSDIDFDRIPRALFDRRSVVPKPFIGLVICGAETGPGARPMNLDWARSLRDQCIAAGVQFFFKRDSNGSRMLDGRLWEQMPEVVAFDAPEVVEDRQAPQLPQRLPQAGRG